MALVSKVRPGTPICADHWNSMVDAILAARNLTSDGTLQLSRGQHGTHLGLAPRSTGLPIKNDNSGELPAFGVAYVKSIDTSTWPGLPVLVVDQIGSTFQRDLLVNGPLPIAAGGFGLAQNSAVVTVAYDSGTPAVGEGLRPQGQSVDSRQKLSELVHLPGRGRRGGQDHAGPARAPLILDRPARSQLQQGRDGHGLLAGVGRRQ